MPSLRFLHDEASLNRVKLEGFRRMTTGELKFSLMPGEPGCLKTRPDGTLLDGHHRITVLKERGEDVNKLPREALLRG